MSVHKEETPFTHSVWLSPKLLTCPRLAQITDGQRQGRRERKKGRGFLSFQMANMHLADRKHNACVCLSVCLSVCLFVCVCAEHSGKSQTVHATWTLFTLIFVPNEDNIFQICLVLSETAAADSRIPGPHCNPLGQLHTVKVYTIHIHIHTHIPLQMLIFETDRLRMLL